MRTCNFCGKRVDFPFRCRYCGGEFCADHHLPESHNCPNMAQWEARRRSYITGSSGAVPPAAPIAPRKCAQCGILTPDLFFCPGCGNEHCRSHRLPADHACPSFHDIPQPPVDRKAVKPLPRSPEKRAFPPKAVSALFLIAVLVVTVAAGIFYFSYLHKGGQASSGQEGIIPGQTAAIRSPSPAPTTVPPTAAPLPVKVPGVFRVTPTPTLLNGIVSYPHIAADSSRGVIVRNYTFAFQDATVLLNGSVNASVYNGAKNGDKAVIMNRESIDRRDWAPGYFRAIVNDYHQEAFYANLISSFRKIRTERGLSDDEYLELMTAFVQSMEYDTAGARDLDNGNRFPVETFVDGKGVCGDKSMLLAGLLAREGYDVALFVFDPEKHMGVGVRSGTGGYRNTSYVYIETTRLSYAGVVPDELAGGITLSSMPYLIPIGNGWKGYSAAEETRYLGERLKEAEGRIMALRADLSAMPQENLRYNLLVDEHNQYVAVYNYINSHEYDRPGSYAYAVTHGKTSLTPPAGTQDLASSETAYATCTNGTEPPCRAGSRCCAMDNTCYAWCTEGVWVPDLCACRI